MRGASLGIRVLGALVLLGATHTAMAQATCQLTCPPCSGTPSCRGGCSAPRPLEHRQLRGCDIGGSFGLRGTEYESACAFGTGGCRVAVPPVRWWVYDSFQRANSGCQDPLAGPALINQAIDAGIGSEPGHWLFYQANWLAPAGDGCPQGDSRVVAEMSFADSRHEGTIDHRGWYLVASVLESGGRADFDGITGGTGCNSREPVAALVPDPRLGGGSFTCRGSTLSFPGVPNPVDPAYYDVTVDLPATAVDWWSEAGRSQAPALIAGYQVMYHRGAEPTSSMARCGTDWLPVRDPAAPSQAHAVVPLGTAQVVVSLPMDCAAEDWLALRLIYQDATINPLGPWPAVGGIGPKLASVVGGHCGPVVGRPFEPTPHAESMSVDPPPPFSARPGDPVGYDIVLEQMSIAPATLVVTDVLPACLDMGGFDPLSQPDQVTLDGVPAALSWDAATRRLEVTAMLGPLAPSTLRIRGLRAGPDDPACCNTATVAASPPDPCGTGTVEACLAIDSSAGCAAVPPPVTGLYAVRMFDSVRLQWLPALDPATFAYNVWKVVDGDKARIPVANRATARTDPAVRAVCTGLTPVPVPSCTEPFAGGFPAAGPQVVFYQVRAACSDASEGTAHPF